MPEPFLRPEDEKRQYETLIAELEQLIEKLKKDIKDSGNSLVKDEQRLAELLSTGDEYQKELAKEIESLLSQWRKLQDLYRQNPQDEENREELNFIEEQLASATNQKLNDLQLTNQEVNFLRSDIIDERKHLTQAAEFLASWEQDKVEILKDKSELEKLISEFKKMYESEN